MEKLVNTSTEGAFKVPDHATVIEAAFDSTAPLEKMVDIPDFSKLTPEEIKKVLADAESLQGETPKEAKGVLYLRTLMMQMTILLMLLLFVLTEGSLWPCKPSGRCRGGC